MLAVYCEYESVLHGLIWLNKGDNSKTAKYLQLVVSSQLNISSQPISLFASNVKPSHCRTRSCVN